MRTRKQKQEQKIHRKNLMDIYRQHGCGSIRTYIAVDYYKGCYPQDSRFIEVLENEYGVLEE